MASFVPSVELCSTVKRYEPVLLLAIWCQSFSSLKLRVVLLKSYIEPFSMMKNLYAVTG